MEIFSFPTFEQKTTTTRHSREEKRETTATTRPKQQQRSMETSGKEKSCDSVSVPVLPNRVWRLIWSYVLEGVSAILESKRGRKTEAEFTTVTEPIRRLFQLRGVNRIFYQLADEGIRRFISKDEWLMERFERWCKAVSKDSAPAVVIQYQGYEGAIMWENYKFIDGIRVKVRCRVWSATPIEDIVRVGVVYTNSQWREAHWREGDSSGSLWLSDPRGRDAYPDTEDFRVVPVSVNPDRSNPSNYDTEAFYSAESCWFSRRDLDVVLQKIDSHTGFFTFKFFDTSSWAGYRPELNQFWFAVYADDKHGRRYWDNNNGWNYEAYTREYYVRYEKSKLCEGGLRDVRDCGWQGT